MESDRFTEIYFLTFNWNFIWPLSRFQLEVLRKNTFIIYAKYWNNFLLNSQSIIHILIPNPQACKEKQYINQVTAQNSEEARFGDRNQWGLRWPAEDLTHLGFPRSMACHHVTQPCMQNTDWEACRAGPTPGKQPLLRLNSAYRQVELPTQISNTHMHKWEPALENSWRPNPEPQGWTWSLLGSE